MSSRADAKTLGENPGVIPTHKRGLIAGRVQRKKEDGRAEG